MLVDYGIIYFRDYQHIKNIENFSDQLHILDHLQGFDLTNHNEILEYLNHNSLCKNTQIFTAYMFDDRIRSRYSNLDLKFSLFQIWPFTSLTKFENTYQRNFKNFLCCFNGGGHVSRQFLTSALYKRGWFNPEYCSKNFTADRNQIDGNVQFYSNELNEQLHHEFIIDYSSDAGIFYSDIIGYDYSKLNHHSNLTVLNQKLSESFVNVISESLATSNYPFVSEKFLYSVLTKGLFVAYAQPGWHTHLETCWGFKKFTKVFDYSFDLIINPIERLMALFAMLEKFNKLSAHDWHDLYKLEQDTIDFNYDHYHSKNYLHILIDQTV
jgi:hypothetical protein